MSRKEKRAFVASPLALEWARANVHTSWPSRVFRTWHDPIRVTQASGVDRPEGGLEEIHMATSQGYSGILKNRGFVFLLAAQALAVFDDNTFKQLLMLFVTASIPALATRNLYISLGTALYVLPYIVFSSYAGQVADHFSKRRVIIFMKMVEATLLIVATFAMFVGHVIAMLAVLFLLGIHACFLDPAKEGILPQIFPKRRCRGPMD